MRIDIKRVTCQRVQVALFLIWFLFSSSLERFSYKTKLWNNVVWLWIEFVWLIRGFWCCKDEVNGCNFRMGLGLQWSFFESLQLFSCLARYDYGSMHLICTGYIYIQRWHRQGGHGGSVFAFIQ